MPVQICVCFNHIMRRIVFFCTKKAYVCALKITCSGMVICNAFCSARVVTKNNKSHEQTTEKGI